MTLLLINVRTAGLQRVLNMSGMEVGVASYTSGRPVGGSPDRARGPPRANLHVEFAQLGEVKERKEKYLTAKYGAHQMSLIRKRLGVEMWMFDQLQSLYPTPEGKHEEKELDLDELLDIEGELKRKKFLWDSLADCKQSKDKIEKFIDELLERATTL
ncbi:protein phosphatase 1 regulatory subunit 14C isoform X3 [Macrobrachium rosenbergii]|uniref:protein phosphatase 1 regulatory subunit 14C isoform X3 n=1 Tax=Macrobrachium rosenbergii TaxID=79674 RepID=UPI0034D6078E